MFSGETLLYLDYDAPVAAIRTKAHALLDADARWDKQVFAVQVTETQPTCIGVRVLASAANANDAFDLRCALREDLITFLRAEYPQSLPKTRLSGAMG